MTKMKRIKSYRGFTIWKSGLKFSEHGERYSVEMPCGSFFESDAASVKTAEKWIDAEIYRRNN